MKNKIIFFMFIFIFLNPISCFEINPEETSIDFQPDLEKEIQFNVINSEHKDMSVVIYVEGELKDYVTLSKNYEDFSSSDESKTFSYSVKLPNDFEEPGQHTADIIVRDVINDFTSSTKFYVSVPYPDNYIEISDFQYYIINDKGEFYLEIFNHGQEEKSLSPIIDIYHKDNLIQTYSFGDIVSVPSKKIELKKRFSLDSFDSGIYIGKAVVDSEIEKEVEFEISKKDLSIESIEVDDFKLGDIAKFNSLIENKWTRKINDVYLTIFVYNKKGEIIAEIKSPEYEIDASSKLNFISYWETQGIEKGNYNGNLILNYENKTIDKNITVDISQNKLIVEGFQGTENQNFVKESDKFNFQKILLYLVLGLICLNLLWFVFLKKYIRKRGFKRT